MGDYDLKKALQSVGSKPSNFGVYHGKETQLLMNPSAKLIAQVEAKSGKLALTFKGTCFKEDGHLTFLTNGEPAGGWAKLITGVLTLHQCTQFKTFVLRRRQAHEAEEAAPEGDHPAADEATTPTPTPAPVTPTQTLPVPAPPVAGGTPPTATKTTPTAETGGTPEPNAEQLLNSFNNMLSKVKLAVAADHPRKAEMLQAVVAFNKFHKAGQLPEAKGALSTLIREVITPVPGGAAGGGQKPAAAPPAPVKADQVIEWKPPADLVFGAPLSEKELNATRTKGDGALSYHPPLGTQLPAGLKQTLTVTAAETPGFKATPKSVTINVKKAPQVIAWAKPADIEFGTPLSDKQLNATVTTGDGKLTYEKPLGTKLNPNKGQKLRVVAAETPNFLATPAEVSINVNPATFEIAWDTPADITYGTLLSAAQINARLTRGVGKLTYEKPIGTRLNVSDGQKLTVTATATGYQTAFATVLINVKPAPQTIEWNNPADIVFGTLLSATQLNATRDAGDGELLYTPDVGMKLPAGTGQTLRVATIDNWNYVPATKDVLINVAKAKTVITWKEPAAVVAPPAPVTNPPTVPAPAPKFKLTAAQLNATSTNDESAAVYKPAVNTLLGEGTHWLRVTYAGTANIEPGEKRARLRVYVNADEHSGYEAMRTTGGAWKATAPFDPTLKANWKADKDKVQTQGKQLMADLAGMTEKSLKAHMNAQVADLAQDYMYQPGAKPNEIWKFPNGLQVRYKPNGDAFSNDPMFCVELRTTAGFSNSQGDIAAKLTSDGEPAPKGPGKTEIPATLDATKKADYKRGTANATHLLCKPREETVIAWDPPADIPYGTPLSEAQLNATLTEGDGALTYQKPLGTQLAVGDNQDLRVDAAQTDGFKADHKIVKINVKKADQVITWDNPADIVVGTPLSATQLNAKRPVGDGAPVFTPPAGTVMPVGDGQTLSVTAGETTNYKASPPKTVTINVKPAPSEDAASHAP